MDAIGKIHPRKRRAVQAMLALTALVMCVSSAAAVEWNPAAFAKEDTLELRTNCPGEGEYWFKVWLVVVDGQVYVRLGGRATQRIECNTTAPFVGVEVAGQRFDHVHGVPAPEQAPKVMAAMAEKYWSDVLVRLFSHPLTLRLVPE
jgi:hypothetical protein